MVIPMKKKDRIPLSWAWMVSSTICLAYFGSGEIIPPD